jgi:hypothetical protein
MAISAYDDEARHHALPFRHQRAGRVVIAPANAAELGVDAVVLEVTDSVR